MTTYLAYVDDSGDESTAVYTALLIPVENWAAVLKAWLEFRANIYTTYAIPADFELHAKELVRAGNGRPAPSLPYGVNSELSLRKRVIETALASIGKIPELRIISKVSPHVTPEACYISLVKTINQMMEKEDGQAILVVDGDGTQAYQKTAHRDLKLASRRVIEDPWHQGAHVSQLVQMADMVSYAAFQAHSLRESRRWMWGFFPTYLHKREWVGCCSCP